MNYIVQSIDHLLKKKFPCLVLLLDFRRHAAFELVARDRLFLQVLGERPGTLDFGQGTGARFEE